MKKIISLFARNYDGDRLVRDEVVPGAEWVIGGEGIATRKWDGTCCMVRDGRLYKRYDAKRGKTPPPNFEAAQDYDEVTGHMPGWLPVGGEPDSWMHREALRLPGDFTAAMMAAELHERLLSNGTYELIGPKVNGSNEGAAGYQLVVHGGLRLPGAPREFAALVAYLRNSDIEGIVWHHQDGRMVKIKKKDFGLPRKP